MSFAISVITPEVRVEAPLALLEGSFEQRLEKAAAYGYQGVELVTCDPAALDVPVLGWQLARHGLKAAAAATGFIAVSRGLTLTASAGQVRRDARQLLEDLIRFAAAIGADLVTIGSFRGRAALAGGPELAREQLHEALSAADVLASDLGVVLALEPINAVETDFLTNAREVCAFMDSGGYRSVKLLLDTYHMFLSEPNPLDAFRTWRDRLAHVHLADSGRRAVGQGTIDFDAVEQTLDQIGYTLWQSMELARGDSPDEAGRSSIRRLCRAKSGLLQNSE